MNMFILTTMILFSITPKSAIADHGLLNKAIVQLPSTTPYIQMNMRTLKQQVKKEMTIIRHDIKNELKQHLSSLGVRQHIQRRSRKRSVEILNSQISHLAESVATQANIIELALLGTNEKIRKLQTSMNNIQENMGRSESDIKGVNDNVISVQTNVNFTVSEMRNTNVKLLNILTNINSVDSKVDVMKLHTKTVKGKAENIEEVINSMKIQSNSSFENISSAFDVLNSKLDVMNRQSTTMSSKMENMNETIQVIQSQSQSQTNNNEKLFNSTMKHISNSINQKTHSMINEVQSISKRINIVENEVNTLNLTYISDDDNYVTLSTMVNSYNNLEARMKLTNESCFSTQTAVSEVTNKIRAIEARMNYIDEEGSILSTNIISTDYPDLSNVITRTNSLNEEGNILPLHVFPTVYPDLSNVITHEPDMKTSVGVSSKEKSSSIRLKGRPINIKGRLKKITVIDVENIVDCVGSSFLVSNQCFRVYRDIKRSWEDAKQRCASEDMVIAQPKDPSALRNYLMSNNMVAGISGSFFWLGARGNGTNIIWNDSQQVLPASDPAWYRDNPGTRVTTYHCLAMLVRSSVFGSGSPVSPYRSSDCTWPLYTICQDG